MPSSVAWKTSSSFLSSLAWSSPLIYGIRSLLPSPLLFSICSSGIGSVWLWTVSVCSVWFVWLIVFSSFTKVWLLVTATLGTLLTSSFSGSIALPVIFCCASNSCLTSSLSLFVNEDPRYQESSFQATSSSCVLIRLSCSSSWKWLWVVQSNIFFNYLTNTEIESEILVTLYNVFEMVSAVGFCWDFSDGSSWASFTLHCWWSLEMPEHRWL